jgi:cell division protein FtsI/penicillin-binding protein 2
MRRAAIVALAIALALPTCGDGAESESSSLFAQAAAAMLRRDFADPRISYLLLDARDGRVLASRWDHAEDPISVGSLVKPFTAVAYARSHDFRFPEHECTGGRTCWLPRGHGHVDLEHAVAFSCNAYFRALAAEVGAAEIQSAMRQLGLEAPTGATPEQLIGLDDSWKIAPLALARAYLELARHPLDPGVRDVLSGMAESARAGTGQGISRGYRRSAALAKTGTAACTHGRAPGDGFAVALVPADAPALLLMVRVHGVPGSRAAVTAGQMLQHLQQNTEVDGE